MLYTNNPSYSTAEGVSQVKGSAANVGVAVTLASGATVTANADGSFTYVPAAGQIGEDSFTYQVSDGINTASATATIQVVNISANNLSYSLLENQNLSTTPADGLLTAVQDSAGNPVLVNSVNGSTSNVGLPLTLSSGAVLTVSPDGSFSYAPPAGFVGNDTFTFQAGDGTAESNSATVTVAVGNPALLAEPDAYDTLNDSTLTQDAAGGVLANDYDSNPQALLTVVAVNGSAGNVGSQITLSSGSLLTLNADGSFTYVPSSTYTGTDSFSYTVSDGTNFSTGSVTVNVTAPALIVNNASYTTPVGHSLAPDYSSGLLGSDYDTAGLSFQITTAKGSSANVGQQITLASGATLTVNANGTFTYAPPAGFSGTDTFTFGVSDGVLSSSASASMTTRCQSSWRIQVSHVLFWPRVLSAFSAAGLIAKYLSEFGEACISFVFCSPAAGCFRICDWRGRERARTVGRLLNGRPEIRTWQFAAFHPGHGRRPVSGVIIKCSV